MQRIAEKKSENIRGFSKHIFWSYKKNTSLPDAVVIRQVVAHGEIADLVLLSKKYLISDLLEVIHTWKEKDRYRKRINLMEKVIIDK